MEKRTLKAIKILAAVALGIFLFVLNETFVTPQIGLLSIVLIAPVSFPIGFFIGRVLAKD